MRILEGITRNVIVLGIVSFLTDVSSEMIFPVVPLFLTTVLGAGKEIVGLIGGVTDSAASLIDIFVGYFSDRSGKRKEFVIAGYGLSSILKGFLVIASSWQQILVIMGVERIGKSIRTSPRDAIISESSDEKNRGKAFGLHRTMDTMGAIVGPLIAYFILSTLGNVDQGFRTVFLFALIPAVLAVLVILFFVREPEPKGETMPKTRPKFWESLKLLDGRYKKFLTISIFFSLAYFSFTLMLVRANDIGLKPQDILLVYVIYNIAYAFGSTPAGIISDKIGRKIVISSSFILYGLVCIGFIFVNQLWQVAALFAIYGIFVAIDDSVNKAYISDISDDKVRGIALGTYNSAVGAVYLPANALFGVIWATMGAATAFGWAAGLAILAGLWMAAQKLA